MKEIKIVYDNKEILLKDALILIQEELYEKDKLSYKFLISASSFEVFIAKKTLKYRFKKFFE